MTPTSRLVTAGAALAAVLVLAAPAVAGRTTVALRDNHFSPKSETISKGASVRFVWKGKAPHNVTVVKGPTRFKSSTKTHGTYTRTFPKAGTYRLVCTIHAGMKMRLRVR